MTLSPQKQRSLATQVVQRLRESGYDAYWAGGCVRDQLMGRTPKDYDVAASATPREIRRLFGRGRTLAIGAAFGVITVLGPKGSGMVEVATFRSDTTYSDGRHPDQVLFSSPREDAARRDFTINGLFYDPIAQQVIDFVGGRDDIERRLIRAIGDPRRRFAEDKLRMLRAVRFSAALDFQIEAETLAAIREMADQITVVSPERIAMEMQRILVEPGRVEAIRLLLATGLARPILPEIVAGDPEGEQRLEHALLLLGRLAEPGFPLALATLLHETVDAREARQVAKRWRLSNQQTDRLGWLVKNQRSLADARSMPWSRLQPLLVADGISDLLALHAAASPSGAEDAAYCRVLLARPRSELDPAPLVTGDDLLARGIPPGPRYRTLLHRIREAQLDGRVQTKAEALARLEEWRVESGEWRLDSEEWTARGE